MRVPLVSPLRTPLITVYKPFLRSYLDYGDVLYNKLKNNNFKN